MIGSIGFYEHFINIKAKSIQSHEWNEIEKLYFIQKYTKSKHYISPWFKIAMCCQVMNSTAEQWQQQRTNTAGQAQRDKHSGTRPMRYWDSCFFSIVMKYFLLIISIHQ